MAEQKRKSLLIITQIVNDKGPVLGFFHDWIAEFSRHFEHVDVICLEYIHADLPKNVTILSLGKEHGAKRPERVFNLYKYVIGRNDEYDTVFVHMNAIYIVLCGLWWKLMKKKVVLWYMHSAKTWDLKIAQYFADTIVSGSKDSYPFQTKKLIVTGHGIQIDNHATEKATNKPGSPFVISTIGRITLIKRIDVLIKAASQIQLEYPIKLFIIGKTVTPTDELYYKTLEILVKKLHLEKQVIFVGPVSHQKMWEYLEHSDLAINLSLTGSLDKSILEAFAAGIPVISSNIAMRSFVKADFPEAYLENSDAASLAQRIIEFLHSSTQYLPKVHLMQAQVFEEHALPTTIRKISEILSA